MKYTPIVLFIMFITQVSFAQKDMVITTKMDTLMGKVMINSGDKYSNDAVTIKLDKSRKKMKAYEVSSILYKGQTVLKTIKLDGRYQFVKLIKEGSFLTLYAYKNTENTSNDYGLQVLIKADGGQHKLGNIGFKKRLASFLTECPDISKKIEEGFYSKKDFNKLIDEYNACVDAKSNASQKEVIAGIEASKIDDLITRVNDSGMKGKEELVDMLLDVKSKMAAQKEVPSYLENAIIEKFEGDSSLIMQFKSIIENK